MDVRRLTLIQALSDQSIDTDHTDNIKSTNVLKLSTIACTSNHSIKHNTIDPSQVVFNSLLDPDQLCRWQAPAKIRLTSFSNRFLTHFHVLSIALILILISQILIVFKYQGCSYCHGGLRDLCGNFLIISGFLIYIFFIVLLFKRGLPKPHTTDVRMAAKQIKQTDIRFWNVL